MGDLNLILFRRGLEEYIGLLELLYVLSSDIFSLSVVKVFIFSPHIKFAPPFFSY